MFTSSLHMRTMYKNRHRHTQSRSLTKKMTSKGLGETVAIEGGPHANR